MSDLGERLQMQADSCRQAGSPLTAAVLDGAASDLAAGGPVATLLGPLEDDPPGTVAPLRLAGALHRMVLERRAPALALHYPSVGGTLGDVWPAARQLIGDEPSAMAELVRRPVQTNEVGRSSALLGGLLHLAGQTGLPVRLLEIGASAGLNLLVDRYAHHVAPGVVLGDPDSPCVLTDPWRGPLPPVGDPPVGDPPVGDPPVGGMPRGGMPRGGLRIVERRGCDPSPLDPASTEDRLTLTSYVWADQVDRFERLRSALAVAGRDPAPVERLTASAFLQRELATPRDGVVTVAWQSVVQQYLPGPERDAVARLLTAAGQRATDSAPLAHLTMEPRSSLTGELRFELALTTWPTGQRRVLADLHGHGPPVVWREVS